MIEHRSQGDRTLTVSDLVIVVGGVAAVVAAAAARYAPAPALLTFVWSVLGIALMAALIARAVEQLGDRLGAGATGVLQSAVGNVPGIVVSYFALRDGLLLVVQYTIIGSMVANLLLILGATFLVGGLKNRTQRFRQGRALDLSVLLILFSAAVLLPSLARLTHIPVVSHARLLSAITAVVLLIIFALSLPRSLSRRPRRPLSAEAAATGAVPGAPRWPLWLAISMLIAAGAISVTVSAWFVDALTPGAAALHISQKFVGLVIIAIAANAIQNAVGLQLAFRNHADYALAVVTHSPLQAALLVTPALVLLSFTTATTLTLVFAPMLVVAVSVAVVVTALVVYDGKSSWLSGLGLISLYAVFTVVVWWT
ncbi:sodium:proton exchanger [Rugosimonospora africana]|uniref:sodium:proton exchanger n=1 Tax=Rugosimonospora africana TaxID=556532 RepID=UPI001EF1F5FB|nr:sodium:proton exchanger [Rugosimonospora africana]